MSDYIVNVCGDVSRAVFLIKGEKNILFDAGMAYSAKETIENIKKELGGKAKVIATGGLASVIAAETEMIDVIDNLLTLQGLYLIYKKNIGESTEEGAKEE